MSQPPANLLLISFDQLRGDWADPCAPVVKLPALQSLAKRSVVARRCYTSSPQCVPARLSWLTGLAPSQMGVTRNTVAEVPADAPSLFRRLQQQGWYTELIGKTHWTSHRNPTDLRHTQARIQSLGFDRVLEVAGPKALRHVRCALTDAWEQEGCMERYVDDMHQRYGSAVGSKAWAVRPSVLPNALYPDLWLTERGLEALNRMPIERPWLLWISFVGPHEPFDTPAPWNSNNQHQTPKPTPQGDWIKQLPPNCELQKAQQRWRGRLTREAIKACRQDYANNLQLLDNQLQRLLDALSDRRDKDQTAIAIASDHGEMLGDHDMLYKGTFLEESIRVPFQYCPPPGLKNRQRTLQKPLGLTEVFSTMLNNLTEGGDAKKFAQEIKKRHICVEFGEELLIIKNNRKLCCRLSGEALWATHLHQDPQEQINQIAVNPKLLQQKANWAALARISEQELQKRKKSDWQLHNCSI
jgi:arylsulfatase